MTSRENGDTDAMPTPTVNDAQREYDNDPELQALLRQADNSPTLRRKRRRASDA